MLLSSQRLRYENLRSLSSASITSNYVAVGTSFVNPVRLLKITNLTDANLLISFNGLDDKDVIAAQSAWIYDIGSNMARQAGCLEQTVGDRVYVKLESTLATTGTVYVTVMYAASN